jgi:hypothetical protein
MYETSPVEPGRNDPSNTLVAQAQNSALPPSVDFGRIENFRRLYLEEQATRYINAGDTDPATPERNLDYNSFAGILNHLADRKDLNDLEKAYVWSTIADRKGEADNLTNRFENAQYSISLDGSKDEIRDSQPFREWNTPNHSVLSFLDGYHGFGNPAPGENQGLAYLDRDTANQRIRNHESFRGISLNDGDIQASTRLVAAFRQYREGDWGEKFERFAKEWQIQMLDTRGQDARDIDQRFRDFGGRAESAELREMRQRVNQRSDLPTINEGTQPVLANANAALQTMPGREQLALNSPESADRLAMLLAADMNRKNISEAAHVFPNKAGSAVFAAASDPQLPQTTVAQAKVQEANEKTTSQAVAELNQSQTERETRQNAVAQRPAVDTDRNVPSRGALA